MQKLDDYRSPVQRVAEHMALLYAASQLGSISKWGEAIIWTDYTWDEFIFTRSLVRDNEARNVPLQTA